ncbi:unnamed protein product [Clonostachys byssicola]|uniref:Uncharacterized protein n=1 Tax=Clonostachys byssicola TaxID=160290 RepID=A0A9N9Y3B0_9HYPO|nr:unnamed protein product [Clonostachys byssicola]
MLKTKQDLIFSIVYEGFGKFFKLKSLIISILTVPPVGQLPNVLVETPLPIDANVRMMSNLRLNARMSYATDGQNLEICLVPRSRIGREKGVDMGDWIGKNRRDTGEEVPIGERTESSVLVSQMRVMRYDLKEGDKLRGCPITVQAFYPDNKMSKKEVWAALTRPLKTQ